MELMIKTFQELTTGELYEILRLRSQVFIVEQQGCYLDPDGLDYKSLHFFLKETDGTVSGCLRLYQKEGSSDTMQIGRVVVGPRRQGLGSILMEAARKKAAENKDIHYLFLTGRRSARNFYQACGYQAALPACFPSEQEAAYFEFSRSVQTMPAL